MPNVPSTSQGYTTTNHYWNTSYINTTNNSTRVYNVHHHEEEDNDDDLFHGRQRQRLLQQQRRLQSTLTSTTWTGANGVDFNAEIKRLEHLRCVGVFAHIDAGKTTVTERMLALAGVVNRAGSVDTGNTVTDYLPAERERGITIQSAAISFPWKWHNSGVSRTSSSSSDSGSSRQPYTDENEEVTIHLIDTPGHVDFSVEVNRSVAVLDGAVLVVDSVAGVQAQTETVWRAIARPHWKGGGENTNTSTNTNTLESVTQRDFHGHEPLSCLAFVNKMDKEGCNFGHALNTIRQRLPGANPVAIQIPLFQVESAGRQRLVHGERRTNAFTKEDPCLSLMAVPSSDLTMHTVKAGKFVGVVDLIEMRAVIWPDVASSNVGDVEECIPDVYNLLQGEDLDHTWVDSQVVTEVALASREELVALLADFDETMEECFLTERSPSAEELRCALRRLTIDRKILPVMTGAALRGKGVEPLLDAIADLLPSPLHRQPPVLLDQGYHGDDRRRSIEKSSTNTDAVVSKKIKFGHPLHPSLLALAFKVIHMKNRGGSGDGRVVFVRIYSGKISTRDTIRVISPNMYGEQGVKPWTERVGGMLELAGGKFDNLKDAVCYSGGVCALVGLKNVSTGDTILSDSHDAKGKKGRKDQQDQMHTDYEIVSGTKCLAGVGAPKPVLTVRIEAENGEQQAKLIEALNLLVKEDPSLEVKETESVTLLSGLGELHIEVVVDRLMREFGLSVWTGKPTVAYRETIFEAFETPGMVNFDRTVGTTRMQAQVHIRLEPLEESQNVEDCIILQEPVVFLSQNVKEYLGFNADSDERELGQRCEIADAILSGCKGALKRGSLSSHAVSNVKCIVQQIDSEGGISSLKSLPGAIRAASSNILMSLLNENKQSCSLVEPTMGIEINVPADMVGTVLSDLTTRRGTVGDVIMADENVAHAKAIIYGQVPLAEILGYANNLRSITNGEGVFSAEYKGHSACSP